MLEKVLANIDKSKEEDIEKRKLAWAQYEKKVSKAAKKQHDTLKFKQQELREYS